eukprot:3240432-Rhodomonas_salina.3
MPGSGHCDDAILSRAGSSELESRIIISAEGSRGPDSDGGPPAGRDFNAVPVTPGPANHSTTPRPAVLRLHQPPITLTQAGRTVTKLPTHYTNLNASAGAAEVAPSPRRLLWLICTHESTLCGQGCIQ